VSPLLVNYNEAAAAAAGGPAINHPFRVCISPALSMNRLVWPARHAVYSGSATSGLPMGARLQLTSSWYNANINSFDPIDRAVVTAMYANGVIVADLANGGLWLEGVNDQRWTIGELQALAGIPDSAFQVLDTIKPPVSFTGPTTGTVGVGQTFTLQYLIAGDSNFSSSLYINVSSDGGNTWTSNNLSSGWFQVNDTHRGPFTLTFTPPAAGTYLLQVNYGGNEWIAPPMITFTATSPSTMTSAAMAMPATTGATSSLAMAALPENGGAQGGPASPLAMTASAEDGGTQGSLTTTLGTGGFQPTSNHPHSTLGHRSGRGHKHSVVTPPHFSLHAVQPRNGSVRTAQVRLPRSLPSLAALGVENSSQIVDPGPDV
jgi:hypothetical protein